MRRFQSNNQQQNSFHANSLPKQTQSSPPPPPPPPPPQPPQQQQQQQPQQQQHHSPPPQQSLQNSSQFFQMNTNIHKNLIIYHFRTNVLTNIYYKDNDKLLYLSCNKNNTEVGFVDADDGNGCQKWYIESDDEDDDIFYIKTAFYHPTNSVKYLGCPNQSGLTYLYTSKNRYTEWRLTRKDGPNFEIVYNGEKFDKNKINVVVARFAEDVTWTRAYADIVTIYNKGANNHPALQDAIRLENVGREGHTYLHHIIENYDGLSEQTVFLQADPFIHNPTILCGIDNHFLLDDVQSLGLYYVKTQNLPPIQYAEENKIITDYGLEYLKIRANGDLISPDFIDQGMIDLRINADNDYKGVRFQSKPVTEGFLNRAIFPVKKSLDAVVFSFSGLFAIHRPRILNYSKIVYQGLIEELISKNPQGGVNGYILEKLWLYIFED